MIKLNIVVMSAMQEEVGSISKYLKSKKVFNFGDLNISNGIWESNTEIGIELNIFLAFSGWGKVSASRAISRILSLIKIDEKIDFVIFTGVAGAANLNLKQWDIVISEAVIQYDMDARPLFDRFIIPALNKSKLVPNKKLFDKVYTSLSKAKYEGNLNDFGEIHKGLIGTGDRFISSKAEIQKIKNLIPEIKAVEMEGGAVAQVCEQEGIPWIIIRTISDNADEKAPESFSDFLDKYKFASAFILIEIFKNLKLI